MECFGFFLLVLIVFALVARAFGRRLLYCGTDEKEYDRAIFAILLRKDN